MMPSGSEHRVKSLYGLKARPFQLTVVTVALILSYSITGANGRPGDASNALATLGGALFSAEFLSKDGRVSCQSCHDPAIAYASHQRLAVGIQGRVGTRNAPSLIGISKNTAYFWDGRRKKLEEAVLDPFTNPVELGLESNSDLLARIERESTMQGRFRAVFGPEQTTPTLKQVGAALVAFIQSIDTETISYDRMALPPAAERGRQLFEGNAGCAECHVATRSAGLLSDGLYHHSGVGEAMRSAQLPILAQSVLNGSKDPTAIGRNVLTDAHWSSLGRYVVSLSPADIGAFRTPSLRNVAVTAPYMHDGSLATLEEVVDHEVYYRSLSPRRPVNVSESERRALVAFLESLTDVRYRPTTE